MEKTILGKTGLEVSRLGLGVSEIGHILSLEDERQAGEVLNAALDLGINFLDTAACYGVGEELIGRTVSHRRDQYVLATKAGHVTEDYSGEPWTANDAGATISFDGRLMFQKDGSPANDWDFEFGFGSYAGQVGHYSLLVEGLGK